MPSAYQYSDCYDGKRLACRDVIINTRDHMQSPGQTQIFYKMSQTRLTREKCDPVDPDDLDDPTQLQR